MSEPVVESARKQSFSVIKSCSKLAVVSIAIGLVSLVVAYYLTGDEITEQVDGIGIKFRDNVDQKWIKDLQTYLVNEYDTPTEKWESYTKNLARCYAICNETSDNISIVYDSNCRTQPIFIQDSKMTEELLSSATFAEATLPCFLKISESRIPTAGRGVFTKKYKIPKGIIFGPYLGKRTSLKEGEVDPSNYEYSWSVKGREKFTTSIDGTDENNSNWLRYINCARYREEQNIFPLLFNDNVYYMTIKDIEPDTELLIWYGFSYARRLKIFVLIESTNFNRSGLFAPLVNETVCPSCPIKKGYVIK